MAWLARGLWDNPEMGLRIFDEKPIREYEMSYWYYNGDYNLTQYGIALPSDADEKLIGRHIAWEDEPVEI